MRKHDNPLDLAFHHARPALLAVVLFSLCINLLMLTAPLYMLQVYDRVLVSRSSDTLVFLTTVALGALIVFGILEIIRTRVLVRIGGRFDQTLSSVVFDTAMRTGRGSVPFRDLETIRGFMTGPAVLALLDAPWTPLYIALIYLLHPSLGHLVLAGAMLLWLIALTNEMTTREPLRQSAAESAQANQFAESGSRNREAIEAMGMLEGLAKVWRGWHDAGLAFQAKASDRAGVINGLAKFLRITVQIGVLGVGAYLAINEIVTPGVMIAASIISSRALAPVEAAISGWRNLVMARDAHRRLNQQLGSYTHELQPMNLPTPKGEILFDNVVAIPPGGERPVLSGANFRLEPGTTLGMTGPSAAGKSTIARLMVGVWQPSSGEVRLDKAELCQWDRSQLGSYIGYLPQDVELFSGTVAENIARFGEIDPHAVVEAAQLAGAHETILTLSNGYDTNIGPGGDNLSGGQRQRVGMARAFYRMPPLVVLDEPTSNLDATGEASVRRAVERLKGNGSTVVMIAHRPTLLSGVEKMMVVQQGVITHFGPTSEVMPQVTRRVSLGSTAMGT